MIAANVERLTVRGTPLDILNSAGSRTLNQAVAVATWIARARCGLSGHLMLRHFEPNRMSLECMHCGERSAGWTFPAGRS